MDTGPDLFLSGHGRYVGGAAVSNQHHRYGDERAGTHALAFLGSTTLAVVGFCGVHPGD